jgi:hypothetical protein
MIDEIIQAFLRGAANAAGKYAIGQLSRPATIDDNLHVRDFKRKYEPLFITAGISEPDFDVWDKHETGLAGDAAFGYGTLTTNAIGEFRVSVVWKERLAIVSASSREYPLRFKSQIIPPELVIDTHGRRVHSRRELGHWKISGYDDGSLNFKYENCVPHRCADVSTFPIIVSDAIASVWRIAKQYSPNASRNK